MFSRLRRREREAVERPAEVEHVLEISTAVVRNEQTTRGAAQANVHGVRIRGGDGRDVRRAHLARAWHVEVSPTRTSVFAAREHASDRAAL